MADAPSDAAPSTPGDAANVASDESAPSDEHDTGTNAEGSDERRDDRAGTSDSTKRGTAQDLRTILRQLTTPMVESLDARLRDQVEAHVDELLDQKVDAALRARLATIDRAVADLSRSLSELERRVDGIEHGSRPD